MIGYGVQVDFAMCVNYFLKIAMEGRAQFSKAKHVPLSNKHHRASKTSCPRKYSTYYHGGATAHP